MPAALTQAHAHAPTHAQFRILCFSTAALVCSGAAYFALTGKFAVLTHAFEEPPVVAGLAPPLPAAPPPMTPRATPPDLPPLVHDLTAPPLLTILPVPDVIADIGPPTPPVLTGARFLEQPSGRDFTSYYPRRALERGQSGRVVLSCDVSADGRMACRVASEEPVGWGFGEASLNAARHFRVAPLTADGRPTSGGTLNVPMVWRAE